MRWDEVVRKKDEQKKDKKTALKARLARHLRTILIFAGVIAAVIVLILLWGISGGSNPSAKDPALFTVSRGDLTISVTESGDIKAVNSKDIKSEVEGRTTIISIVDEGTYISQEDVNNGKVLVELDSSDIEQKLTQQEVSFLSSEASYAEAKESLDIQKKQNDSDVQGGWLKARFALMDFKKYLGEIVAEQVIERVKESQGLGNTAFEQYLEHPQLGGEALQELKKLNDDITLAESKFERASDKLQWTRKLREKEYVAETELKADELEVESLKVQKERAQIALELFKLYEFPKEAEQFLSDYHEAERELERIEARARSKLAQAQAKLASNEAQYRVQKEQLEKLRKQLKACVITAPSPGQVVYSSSTDAWARRNRPIEIGAEIRERQKIISIPDTTEMKVEIKVHETWVDKVESGQDAKITIPAFPDESFTGKVLKKAPLAEQQNWFLNTDLKVYATDVGIDGTYDFIKTGMSAKVEIIIEQLRNVLSVPIQAVITQEEKKLCYVMTNNGPQKREVETGLFNADFVEIKSGLKEGEKVLLKPPRPGQTQEAGKKRMKSK
jgi:HlyD family secretion protein